jgi:hypothetical protein
VDQNVYTIDRLSGPERVAVRGAHNGDTMRTTRILIILHFMQFFQGCGCSSSSIEGDGNTDGNSDDATWDPSIELLGDAGWRDSTEPWCPGTGEQMRSYDVWSNEETVHVIISETVLLDGYYQDVNHIYKNSGTGWELVHEASAASIGAEDTTCFINITGTLNSQILLWGTGTLCTLAYLYEGMIDWEPTLRVYDVFVVNDELAYAIADMAGSIKAVRFLDGTWEPIPVEIPYSVNNIWGNDSVIFLVGSDGTIMSIIEERLTIHDSGTIEDITAVWGFSPNDVWVGQESGMLRHFDGTIWTEVDWPRVDGQNISGMWGTDSTLFFHTAHTIAAWSGGIVRVLGRWLPDDEHPGIGIASVWGNSTEEVFLSVIDNGHYSEACGPEYLLWWDGSEFHWF